jgi:hypothetical protein
MKPRWLGYRPHKVKKGRKDFFFEKKEAKNFCDCDRHAIGRF